MLSARTQTRLEVLPEAAVILVVDDEPGSRRLVGRILEPRGYLCLYTDSVQEARSVLEAIEVALVLCDIGLPDESGLNLVSTIQELHPDTTVVMVTGQDDPVQARLSLERGASGYLVKPFGANELAIGVINALHRRQLERDNAAYRRGLEHEVAARTLELTTALRELSQSRQEVIRRLSRAIETRDSETGAHTERIGELSGVLGRSMHLPESQVELLQLAAPMHDVGKIGIADAILNKPEALNEGERAEMRRHTEIGGSLLSGSEIPVLELAAEIARTHHERIDGSGYPAGLCGDEIPIEGRIVAVADVYDALTSDRVYRPALAPRMALKIISSGVDGAHDPNVVACLSAVIEASGATER